MRIETSSMLTGSSATIGSGSSTSSIGSTFSGGHPGSLVTSTTTPTRAWPRRRTLARTPGTATASNASGIRYERASGSAVGKAIRAYTAADDTLAP